MTMFVSRRMGRHISRWIYSGFPRNQHPRLRPMAVPLPKVSGWYRPDVIKLREQTLGEKRRHSIFEMCFGVVTLVGTCSLLKNHSLRNRAARWGVQPAVKIAYLAYCPRLTNFGVNRRRSNLFCGVARRCFCFLAESIFRNRSNQHLRSHPGGLTWLDSAQRIHTA